MRSSANLLAISEPPRSPVEGKARQRSGSLMLNQPPDDTTLHDFRHSVLETYKQISILERDMPECLPEYLELFDGPDGVYAELTVEYDITPSRIVPIPLDTRPLL